MLAARSQGDVYSEASSSLPLSGASVPAFNCHHASLPRAGSSWRCPGARLPQGEILSSALRGRRVPCSALLMCHEPGAARCPPGHGDKLGAEPAGTATAWRGSPLGRGRGDILPLSPARTSGQDTALLIPGPVTALSALRYPRGLGCLLKERSDKRGAGAARSGRGGEVVTCRAPGAGMCRLMRPRAWHAAASAPHSGALASAAGLVQGCGRFRRDK